MLFSYGTLEHNFVPSAKIVFIFLCTNKIAFFFFTTINFLFFTFSHTIIFTLPKLFLIFAFHKEIHL